MAKNKGGANITQRNFLIQHVEKLGLAVAVLIGAMLVSRGFSTKRLDSSKTPDTLRQTSNEIRTFIESPSWEGENGLAVNRSAPQDYPERVAKLEQPILSQNYASAVPFDPPTSSQTTRRSDPNLYVAANLQAFAITGGLAYKKTDERDDPTVDDQDAEIKEEKKPKARKPKRKNEDPSGLGNIFGGGAGGDEGGGNMAEMMQQGGGEGEGQMAGMGSGSSRQLDAKKLIGFRPGNNQILESGTVLPTGGGRAAAGAAGGAEGGAGMMTASLDDGGGPGSEGGGGMSEMMSQQSNTASSTAISVGATVVGVTGVFPFKKQWDEYNRVLQGASGYESSRDRPRFVFLRAERVDVTDDPARVVQDGEWTQVTHTNQHRSYTKDWDGSPRELVDEQYLDPFVTFVAPPLMMREIDDLLTHPDIPLRNAPVASEEPAAEEQQPADVEQPSDLPGGFLEQPAAGGGNRAGGQPAGGGGMAGMMGGGGGMAGMMGGGGGMEGMMGGMGGMAGMMGGMGGGGGAVFAGQIPEFKLIRFFDFSAVPGRVYRYRVKLLLEDPNHPNINVTKDYRQHAAPPLRSLDQDVVDRINGLNDGQGDPQHRLFFRETEWSDPTEPVYVPIPTQVFAGGIQYQTPSRDSQQRSYQDKEPVGVVKPVIWDELRGVDIPHAFTIHRGAVLNSELNVEYAHPVSSTIKAVEKFDFQSNLIVGDIRGGDELPGSTRTRRVLSPGEFAFIDAEGSLIVRNELDDLDLFDRYDFTPRESTSGAGEGGMGAMMGGEGGEGGGNMAEMMQQGGGGR